MGDGHDVDLYFSADVEADGPIPSRYSMLSFGLCVAGSFDGKEFIPADPSGRTFYRELRPLTDEFDPGAVEASGLDRDSLIREGQAPGQVMSQAAAWVHQQLASAERPILVAYPLGFDWMFLYWYFVAFSKTGSPFDFSSALDMKTMYQQKARVPVSRAGRNDLPPELRSTRPHTHNALDDAIEQAEIFGRLFEWDGRG